MFRLEPANCPQRRSLRHSPGMDDRYTEFFFKIFDEVRRHSSPADQEFFERKGFDIVFPEHRIYILPDGRYAARLVDIFPDDHVDQWLSLQKARRHDHGGPCQYCRVRKTPGHHVKLWNNNQNPVGGRNAAAIWQPGYDCMQAG